MSKIAGKEFWYKISYKIHLRRSHSEKTLLRCDLLGCDYMTADKDRLKSHLIQHSDERPFTCSIEGCGKTFKRKSVYLHQISHRSKLIQCTREGCDKTFKAELYLKRHIVYKHSSTAKSYLCRTCGKCFDTMGKRNYHKLVVHQNLDQSIVCQIGKCNQEFKGRYLYRKHIKICHSGKEFRCDHSGCDYVTKKINLISFHTTKHLESRPFVCGIDGCVKAFKGVNNLNNHKKTHISEPFVCNVFGCKKIFKTKRNFNRHMKAFHSILYKCSSVGCEEAFRSYCLYKAHLRKCHNKGCLSCDHSDCDYTTDSKSHLISHLKSHSEERPFVCNADGCGKAYKHNHTLKEHQLTHIETLEENSDAKINKQKNKLLKTNFENRTKLLLSDLNRQSETDRLQSHSLESESNPSILLTITDSINTFECNANNSSKQSKTQVVLCEESVAQEDYEHYRCVWPGCQFTTDQSDQSETHRLVRIGETSYACHRSECQYECNDRIQFIKHIKSHKP